jgi:hypothetical protein
MAKPKRRYVCQACGSVSPRWQGQCTDCAEWNTLVEDSSQVVTPFSARHDLRTGGRAVELVGLDADVTLPERMGTGIKEFDRALGGGLVAGSATLIGGDPGIGKSTLLLQAAANLASQGAPVAYISGEEAADQVRLRARRLGLGNAPVKLAAATSVRDILTTLGDGPPPALVVIDSIQTMHSDLIEGAPGTVSQVRASAQELIRFAKETGNGGRPRRPRHQGRLDRRAARARAYGRYGAELRGRAQPPIPHPARRQEPLRRHRRDRRLRDGGGGARRRFPTLALFLTQPGRGGLGRRRLPGARRHAAGAGRDPGAHGRPAQRRDAAAGRGRLGQRAA